MLYNSLYTHRSVDSVLIWFLNQFHSISFKYSSPLIQHSGRLKKTEEILESIVILLQSL